MISEHYLSRMMTKDKADDSPMTDTNEEESHVTDRTVKKYPHYVLTLIDHIKLSHMFN